MSYIKDIAKGFANFVYKHFEANGSGAMILLTSMTGIALSAIAQTGAIFINSKYTPSQKAFMIPQELTDGCITILSMLLITTPFQKISKKAVSTTRIRSKDISEYIKKYNLFNQKSSQEFQFSKSVNDIIQKIKNTDTFIKSSAKQQDLLLKEHNDILQHYDTFNDMTSAIATTAGSIFSTALVSPLIRNYTASYYQKINLNVYNNMPKEQKEKHEKFVTQVQNFRYNPYFNLYKLK